jgi:hypothetical protein
MAPETKKWLGAGAGSAFFLWLLSRVSSAKASTMNMDDFSAGQQDIIERLRAEAERQGVPVELVLATADVESSFKNVKAAKGNSFGPLQVNTVWGYTPEQLQDLDFSIRAGVKILKDYLKKAQGSSERARTFYFCGPFKPCTPAVQARVDRRWAVAAARWGVQPSYPV